MTLGLTVTFSCFPTSITRQVDCYVVHWNQRLRDLLFLSSSRSVSGGLSLYRRCGYSSKALHLYCRLKTDCTHVGRPSASAWKLHHYNTATSFQILPNSSFIKHATTRCYIVRVTNLVLQQKIKRPVLHRSTVHSLTVKACPQSAFSLQTIFHNTSLSSVSLT